MPDERYLAHADVVEDVRGFVATIAATHPAPFVRAGGRFAFYRRMQSLLDDVPAEGWSRPRLRVELAELAATVRDAHTFVSFPMADGELSVRLGVLDGEVRVRAVRSDRLRELVGSRLVAVDGVDRETLLARQRRLRGSETPHGDLVNLALSLRNWRSMAPLLDRDERPGRARFEFERPDGSTRGETLEPTSGDGEWLAPSRLERPGSGSWPAYRLLPEQNAAWLRIPSMSGYRENYEYRGEDLPERTREQARSLYREYTGDAAPGAFDEVLAGLPSALAVFRDLAGEMADTDIETLVVDLRDNRGGMRVLVDLLAYVLYGWDGVVTARARPGAIRHSERFVETRGEGPFDEASESRDWVVQSGEYAIDEGDPSVEEVRNDLVESLPTFERLESPDWPYAGRYTPSEVVVLTSVTTFSAGFSLLTALVRLGADVVGTPPVQSPTYFGDVVSFDLRNSEITAMTATSRIETLPDGPDDVLSPDRELTAEDWRRYDFDRDASVLLTLDEYA